MSVIFNSSILLFISLQYLLLNFAFVQSRVIETKDSNAYYTNWKVNSTNLYLDTANPMGANRTEIPFARMHEDAYLILSRSLNGKKMAENQVPHLTREMEMGYWNVNETDRTQGLFSNITEEHNSPPTGRSMDTSQKSYRTVSAAMRNGDSWPWGKSKSNRTPNENIDSTDSTRKLMEDDRMANSAPFICKNQITQLTVLLSLYISIFHFQYT